MSPVCQAMSGRIWKENGVVLCERVLHVQSRDCYRAKLILSQCTLRRHLNLNMSDFCISDYGKVAYIMALRGVE